MNNFLDDVAEGNNFILISFKKKKNFCELDGKGLVTQSLEEVKEWPGVGTGMEVIMVTE